MRITFGFRLVLKLRFTLTVEGLRNISVSLVVSSILMDLRLHLWTNVWGITMRRTSLLDYPFLKYCLDCLQLHQKGFYPYSSDSYEKFPEKFVPSVENWTIFLQDGLVSISTYNRSLPRVWVRKSRLLAGPLPINGLFAACMYGGAVSRSYLLYLRIG